MTPFTFTAIGTQWQVSVDGGELADDDAQAIVERVDAFEKRFSRFLADSEVNAFRNAAAGEYQISDEFAILLKVADRLRELTGGVFDPAVGALLEAAGYNAEYSMRPSAQTVSFTLPKWTLDGHTLILDGPASFDLGGIGKGYCIDTVVALLRDRDHTHFTVDAGGDMYVTTKRDGSPYRIAIQYPGDPDTAAGIVELKDQALAVSDSFRRSWGAWHHIVDPYQKKAIDDTIGAAAVAPHAWYADCMTSGLFLTSEKFYQKIAQEFEAAYLVFKRDGSGRASSNWPGELFT